MSRPFFAYLFAVVVAAALAAVGIRALVGSPDEREVARAALVPPAAWSEVDWPFLNDAFGKGRAFECAAGDCGVRVRVAFRAKIGFCNCSTGVADDDELDRVGDVYMVAESYDPLGPGASIAVGSMRGRARRYVAHVATGDWPLLSVAYNDRCDVVVVIADSPDAPPDRIEAQVMRFLNSDFVVRWSQLTLAR
jgi:hypothetical protein